MPIPTHYIADSGLSAIVDSAGIKKLRQFGFSDIYMPVLTL